MSVGIVEKLKYFWEEFTNKPLRLDYNPRILMCRESQRPIRRHRPCHKEPETCKWIDDYVKPGDIFFDVGACAGGYSFVAELRGAKVYAFEPKAFLIKKNIEMNNSAIQLIEKAIGNEPGKKLDDFARQFNTTPDHIKIDVDGVELGVVERAEDVIRKAKTMMIEISENKERVMELIGKYMTLKATYKREAPNTSNYLFVRK